MSDTKADILHNCLQSEAGTEEQRSQWLAELYAMAEDAEGVESSGLLPLDEIMIHRIQKWETWKKNPDRYCVGCSYEWFDGWCDGKIQELQNVRGMISEFKEGGYPEWARPNDAKSSLFPK